MQSAPVALDLTRKKIWVLIKKDIGQFCGKEDYSEWNAFKWKEITCGDIVLG